MADRHDFPRLHDVALALLAHLDWLTGAWSGLAECAAALAGHEEPITRMGALLVDGFLDMVAGRCRSGEEKLELVVSDARQRGWVGDQAEPSAALARVRLAVGQVEDALKLTDDPMRVIMAKRTWIGRPMWRRSG